MITTIIFSYDRAMQLELLLESIFMYDTKKQLDVHIVYSCSSTTFDMGYKTLISKYPTVLWHKETAFKEQFVWPILPLYWHNYLWWLKYKHNRTIKSNFRSLVLSLIEESQSQSIMFLTDDSLFVNPITIQSELLDKVKHKAKAFSYSLRHGVNIWGGNYRLNQNSIEWNISDKHEHSEWEYPFSVDGHIYNKNVLLNVFKKVIFKNPNTLEGNVATYVKEKSLFKQMLANRQSALLGFELNRVQTISDNNNLNISNKQLNELYLDGYKLELDYTILQKHLFRPDLNKVMAQKKNNSIILYEK